MLIDAHSHILDEAFDGVRGNLENFLKSRKIVWIENAIDLEQSEFIVKNYGDKWLYALGIHPHEAEKYSSNLKETKSKLTDLIDSSTPVAIGEAGLDFFKNYSSREAQYRIFDLMLEIALEKSLPVEVHCRACADELHSILKEYPGTIIFHSFTGSVKLLELGLEKGWYFSLSAIVESALLRNDKRRLKVYSNIPLERILLETDSPYLRPKTVSFEIPEVIEMASKKSGMHINIPYAITAVAKILEKVLSVNENLILSKSAENAVRVFKI